MYPAEKEPFRAALLHTTWDIADRIELSLSMNDEKSPLLQTTYMMMVTTKTRRKLETDEYSTIASSASQATIASATIASSENDGDCNEEFPTALNNENDDNLTIDIEEAIDRLGMGLFQIQIVIACGLCFASDALEILLLSFLALILREQWGLSEGQADSIVSVVFLGALMGTLILTPFGDRWGRRVIFAVTAATISLFGIMSAFCNTYPQILIVRFMVGFGIGGLTVPYDALGEFMPNSRRGKNMLSTSFFWTAASLMVPLFAWLTIGRNNIDNDASNESTQQVSWRAFVILCALPGVVSTVLGICFVPESPRWLLTRGKHEKSLQILRQAAAKNGKDPYLVFPENVRLVEKTKLFELEDDDNCEHFGDGVQRNNRIMGGRPENQNLNPDNESNDGVEYTMGPKTNKCCLICSNSKWRKISFMLGGQWYGLAFMYYGAIRAVSIVFSKYNDNNKNGFDFDYVAILIASSAEIVGLTLAILLVDRIGRVSSQIWTYSLGGLCLLLLGFLDYSMGKDAIDGNDRGELQRQYLIGLAFLSRMFIMGATSITWLHTAEILPTRFRATGHGLGEKFVCLVIILLYHPGIESVVI